MIYKIFIILAAILGALGFLIVVCLVVLGFLVIRNRKIKRKHEDNEEIAPDTKTDFELQRNENLSAKTDNVEKLYEEFRNIESQAKEEALEETTITAYEEDHRAHNRYGDIGKI